MNIYDANKKHIITDYNPETHKLVEDIIVKHHDYIPEVLEKSHIELINELPNGSKEYAQIIDVPYSPAIEAYDETEKIYVCIPYTEAEILQNKLQELRHRRIKLLKMFDIYKTNVNYGIIKETEEDNNTILKWYQNILDLQEEAFNNVPEEILKYKNNI